MLTVLMALIASLPAWAASRVVISTPEPMQVFVDGMLEPTSVGSIRVACPTSSPESTSSPSTAYRGSCSTRRR